MKEKPNFRIIERSDEDLDRETEELFKEIQPLLDNGLSIKQAVKVTKNATITGENAWYKKLKEYCKERGYTW